MANIKTVNIVNKIAIVTGGANGIGYACVYNLLEQGARFVAIFDTSENVWLDDLEDRFGKHRAAVYHCDVSIEDEFKSNFEKVVEKYKNVDILINDAGIANENNISRLIDINVKGTILGNLIAIKHMGIHNGGKGGVIVNVASIIGLLDCHVLPVYSASKHAVVSFTRSMKQNCKNIGIKILAICPGHTDTTMHAEMEGIFSNYLDFVPKDGIEHFQKHYVQSPDSVGEAIISIIMKGEAGTVWVVENDEIPFKVNSTDNYTKKIIERHESKLFFCW